MGPLSGIRVIELAGKGPVPFCGMLLSDMGADVIRIDRFAQPDADFPRDPRYVVSNRGRRSIALDLKHPSEVGVAKKLIQSASVLIEGYRPGVTERMGLGPDACWKLNPQLIYGRMTGWGQTGPVAQGAGHDINYIALTGALDAIGPSDGAPVAPVNLLGDFGGGSMYLAFGIVCALLEAQRSGRGQVVDTAIVDGVTHLMADMFGKTAEGKWGPRGTNLLDGGSPFYGVYATRDDLYVSVGAIEKGFFDDLLSRLGMNPGEFDHHDQRTWPLLREKLGAVLRSRTRAEWCSLLEGTNACFAPVLTLQEAKDHPHMRERATVVRVDGIDQPAPAPRFSRSQTSIQRPPPAIAEHSDEVLLEIGLSAAEIEQLHREEAVR